jgi:hypothetical protein
MRIAGCLVILTELLFVGIANEIMAQPARQQANKILADWDGDGIADELEGGIFPAEGKTNTYLSDSDGDGVSDGVEDANQNGVRDAGEMNPRERDSDGDGIDDGIEVNVLSSDPLDPGDPSGSFVDADLDGLPSFLDPNDAYPDYDGDRFLDGYEAAFSGLSAVMNASVKPSLGDTDEDGDWDEVDVQLILDFFSNRPAVGINTNSSDLNRDGRIDNVDAQLARNFLVYRTQFLPYVPGMPIYPTPTPAPPTATHTQTPTVTNTRTPTQTPEFPTPTPNVGNLLLNPGAETGDFSYWTIGGQKLPVIDPVSDIPSPPNHSGNHRFGLSAGWETADSYQYQTVNVVPGASYQASMWIVRENGTDESLEMTWFDGDWQQGTERRIYMSEGAQVVSWTLLSGVSVIPTRDRVTIVLRYRHDFATDIASIHVDDLVLYGPVPGERTPSPTPTITRTLTITPTSPIPSTPTKTPMTGGELLANGSFEGTFAGNGVAQGWNGFAVSPNGFWKENQKLGRLGGGIYGCYAQPGPAGFDCIDDYETVRMSAKTNLISLYRYDLVGRFRDELGPEVITVAKTDAEGWDIYPDGDTWPNNAYDDGRRFAQFYYDFRINPNPGFEADAYYGLNEPSVNDVEHLRKVCAFERGFTDRIHELGYKAIVLNNSVGTPGDIANFYIQEVRDLLAVADYVGYHAYGDWTTGWMCPSYAEEETYRWQAIAQHYIDNGWRFPPVIYTEGGQYWWAGSKTPEQVRDDLICYEARERLEEFWSLGLCYFVTGADAGAWDAMHLALYPQIIDGCRATNMAHPVDAHGGAKSQEFGARKQSFDRGIYQQVSTAAGRDYRFTGWLKFEYDEGWPHATTIRVGWDPTGQTANPDAPSVQWTGDLISSGPNNPIHAGPWDHDLWYQYDTTFHATGSTATLWIRGSQPTASPRTPSVRIYADDLSLKEVQ